MLGLSKTLSSDMRDLEEGMNNGNKYAKAAMEVFCYRVAKYIGSYVAAMNGVDAIAFTAGVGENDTKVRARVCGFLEGIGIHINKVLNSATKGIEMDLATEDSVCRVLVVPTNEELAIARETVAWVEA